MKAIISNITEGLHDENLDVLLRAIRNRKDRLTAKTVDGVRSGSLMRFNQTVNPQYLRGQKVEVVKINRRRFKVKLPQQLGRFTGTINCPPNLLEKV